MGIVISMRGKYCLLASTAIASPLCRTLMGVRGTEGAPDRREDRPDQHHETNQDWFKPDMVMADMCSSFIRGSILERESLSK